MGFWAGFAQGFSDAQARKEARKQFEAQIAERRRDTLLQLAAKRLENSKSTQAAGSDLLFLQNRLKGVDGADQYIGSLINSPEAASTVVSTIRDAEKSRGETLAPEDIMGSINVISSNMDNKDVLDRIRSGEDYMTAVLGAGDLGDTSTYEKLYTEGLQPQAKPAVAVDVNPNLMYTQKPDVLNQQESYFDKYIIDAAKAKLQTLGDNSVEATALLNKLNLYGKEGGLAETQALREEFGPQAVENLRGLEGSSPILRGIETNPAIAPYTKPKDITVQQTEPAQWQVDLLKQNIDNPQYQRDFIAKFGQQAYDSIIGS